MQLNFSLETIHSAAEDFLNKLGKHKVVLFDGDMGAGKTTFIAEVCRLLGADDDFGSPTFSLINEYMSSDGYPIYHFDFYRIESPQEALDIGVEDYFESGNLCLVEWPDKLGNLLPDDVLRVHISVNEDNSRTLRF